MGTRNMVLLLRDPYLRWPPNNWIWELLVMSIVQLLASWICKITAAAMALAVFSPFALLEDNIWSNCTVDNLIWLLTLTFCKMSSVVVYIHIIQHVVTSDVENRNRYCWYACTSKGWSQHLRRSKLFCIGELRTGSKNGVFIEMWNAPALWSGPVLELMLNLMECNYHKIYLKAFTITAKTMEWSSTSFRSNDHSKAKHSWGVTAFWSDHHSIRQNDLEAGVTYTQFVQYPPGREWWN